jgi:hypothetical protein
VLLTDRFARAPTRSVRARLAQKEADEALDAYAGEPGTPSSDWTARSSGRPVQLSCTATPRRRRNRSYQSSRRLRARTT